MTESLFPEKNIRRLQSDCVYEQVAKADCEYPLLKR